MKTKITCWLDKNRMIPVFGVAVHRGGRWANVAVGGAPLLFDTKKEAHDARAEYRKMKDVS
jgi:hypothetical protein